MISQLYIENIAVIETADIEFTSGFNALTGETGAGKSTLVRCINLLERPDEGQVLFHGENLMAMPDKALRLQRRKISMIL